MSLIRGQLEEVWGALRAAANRRRSALQAVRIRNLRGIGDLRVPFSYPVSVLAGPNRCGKSTLLGACACAYRVPGRTRRFSPGVLFPNFAGRPSGEYSDLAPPTELEFEYLHQGHHVAMAWRRGKSWNRSYLGRKNAGQPERELYLRTLANLTNPSEVRGILQLARKDFRTAELSPDLLLFADRILGSGYRRLSIIEAGARDLLFADAATAGQSNYSEFHMSSGERAILRLSKDLSRLNGALVLIDEVEVGLHPYTQQQTMLELQRLALRRELQIIVATHSPVVLDSVPEEARLFLDRDDAAAEVRLVPPYRDLLQKALYGQSRDQLSILCEDAVAEGVIHGVLDVLNPQLGMRHDDFVIGRDTGQDEFPGHVRTMGKFDKLRDLLVVLDGDARHREAAIREIAAQFGQRLRPLFLPGDGPPEGWIWDTLRPQAAEYAAVLGIPPADLRAALQRIEQLLAGSVQRRDRMKAALRALTENLNRSAAELARAVAQRETAAGRFPMARFRLELREQIEAWRRRR